VDDRTATLTPERMAADVIAASGGGSIAPFTSRDPALTVERGYGVTPLIRAAFTARGETIVGRKFGFTNRSIWAQYGVYAPIWGYMTDRTTHDLASTPTLAVAHFSEPRIEPEIVFHLARTPSPGMSEAALLDCIDWMAGGYEIVQSIFPQWTFTAPDTVVANGLHGALLIGERHDIAPRKAEWLCELPAFEATLACNGTPIDRGGGASVLEGPLSTLTYVMELLAKDPHNPPLAAGEIVSTGTLTKAMPVKPGETWTTTFSGIPLAPIAIAFT